MLPGSKIHEHYAITCFKTFAAAAAVVVVVVVVVII